MKYEIFITLLHTGDKSKLQKRSSKLMTIIGKKTNGITGTGALQSWLLVGGGISKPKPTFVTNG
jgi:hypothetical protein